MRQLLEAQLVNGPCGDPGLYVDLLGERRALLFDLGELAALPPRKLLRISHVFVSHTHVDHFVGFDTLLRVVLGRKQRIVLCGGPGFVDQVEHRLHAYTWNVVHRYEVALELEVHEFHPDGRARQARFCSRNGFAREGDAPLDFDGDLLHDEPLLRVRGRFVDHEMPCLAFAVEEKARARVARDRLAALGVGTGAWLREFKHALLAGAAPDTTIDVRWRDRDGDHERRCSVGELGAVVLDVAPGQHIGYVTDLRFTDANRRTLVDLLAGVSLLFIESPFLDADADQARRKNHLTSRQAGQIAREVGARMVVPFHFSPRYGSRYGELVDELRIAWRGSAEAPAPPATDDAGRAPWTRALR